MGTTLTGTKPKDTYDSLIKVTDNGPLSGSLKVLTDGLGNNSSLALSTGAASVTGTLAVTTGTNLATASGNVGIGTSGPTAKLTVSRNDAGNVSALIENAFINQGNLLQFNQNTTSGAVTAFIGHAGDSSGDMKFFNGGSERIAILKGGGLTFNGDTAAANALDDYEEGTWTMGVSFGGASVGVTTSNNTGTYTKIGRQVTVNGYILLTSKGSSTNDARITGLPFTIGNSSGNSSSPSLYFSAISFANIIVAYGVTNTTTIALEESTEAGVNSNITNADFANNSAIVITFTYFV